MKLHRKSFAYGAACGLAMLLACAAIHAQSIVFVGSGSATDAAAAGPPATAEEVLQQMTSLADRIFLGSVQSIHLAGDVKNAAVPEWPAGDRIVEVTLSVEECIAGCTGPTVVMREWSSLWRGQPHRYTVGQRAVWILHPENAAGLSSPVNGMLGVLPVKITSDGQGNFLQSVDLRWLQTAVLRKVGAGLPGANAAATVTAQSATAAAPTTAAQMAQTSAALETVMGVLHGLAAAKAASAQ